MNTNIEKWCIRGTNATSLAFLLIAGILYLVDREEYVKVVLCLLLVSFFEWMLLICCRYKNLRDNPPKSYLPIVLWISCFLMVLFFIIFSFFLLNAYRKGNKVSIAVDRYSLDQFNLSSSPSLTNSTGFLNYTISLEFSATQTRKKLGLYVEEFQISADYRNQRFCSAFLPPFYVTENTNQTYNASLVVLNPVLHGRHELTLVPDEINRFQQLVAAEMLTIDLTVKFTGIRCNIDEYKSIREGKRTFKSSKKLQGQRNYQVKQLSALNPVGTWVDRSSLPTFSSAVVSWLPALPYTAIFVGISLCASSSVIVACSEDSFTLKLGVSIGYAIYLVLFGWPIVLTIHSAVQNYRDAHRLEFSIDANLQEFTFYSNETLEYHLSANITVGPNNKKTGIHFTELELSVSYLGYKLTTETLSSSSYLQGRQRRGGRILTFNREVKGRSSFALRGKEIRNHRKNTISNRYPIVIALSYKGLRTDTVLDPEKAESPHGLVLKEMKLPILNNQKEHPNGATINKLGGRTIILNTLFFLFLPCVLII